MLLNNRVRINRILINTWKVDIIMFISCVVAYFFHFFLISKHFDIPVIVPTVLGTAIAFFIGFNNNQAYDRWWEARKIWGSIVNDSRSWARNVLTYLSAKSNDNLYPLQQQLIYRHIAFLYLLKNTLRASDDDYYLKYTNAAEQEDIYTHSNKPNALLQLQAKQLNDIYLQEYLDGYRFLQLDALLTKFTDEMGMSERIKNTVFPTTYTYLTQMFVWLFVVAIELVTVQNLGAWSIFISWLIGFVFVSTQVNGMSLINPFEDNPVGIPLNEITRTIEINLLQMLGEKNMPLLIQPVNNEYIM